MVSKSRKILVIAVPQKVLGPFLTRIQDRLLILKQHKKDT